MKRSTHAWLSLGGLLLGLYACGSEEGSDFVPFDQVDQDAGHVADSTVPPSDVINPAPPCEPGFITQVVGPAQDTEGNPIPLYGSFSGFGQDRYPGIIFGPPQGAGDYMGSLDVLTLGMGGEIIVGFGNEGIADGEGADFIVFENVLYETGDPNKPYAEVAEISVSADLQTWHTFPCASEGLPYTGCAGWHAVFAHPDNGISPFDPETAGGDAFDLAELNVTDARYVRIRDLDNPGFGGKTAGFD